MSECMAHPGVKEEWREHLTLYAFAMLNGDESHAVTRHLDGGCESCAEEVRSITETVSALALAVPPVPPPASLRSRVLDRIRSRGETSGVPGQHVVRAGHGRWKQLAPGVTACRLYLNRERGEITSLLRLEPGATYAPHRHSSPEQCYVLEGDVFDGENRFYAGDYECSEAGTIHHVQSTEHGCVLLIISSIHDEMVEA
jgi:quercetin dioxygenase-like cupin family protein